MKQFVTLIIILLVAGCKTQSAVTSISVDTASTPPVASISVSTAANTNLEISARLFPKYESGRLVPLTSAPEQISAGAYKIILPQLPVGQYRLLIETNTARKFLGIPLGTAHERVTHDFAIHAELPASCFLFDSTANDTMGWTARGVYLNNHTEAVSSDTCPGLFYINVSWPHGLHEATPGGSLFVPVSSECFPRTATPPSDTGMWHFRIVSPDLGKRKDWQGLRAIEFRMATKTIPVTVIPEIEYQHAGRTLGTRDAAKPQTHYQVSSGRWGSLQHPFAIPPDATIRHIVLHVYGQPEKTVTDKVDSIFVDAICPVK